jgi:site-specific recombinase XerD
VKFQHIFTEYLEKDKEMAQTSLNAYTSDIIEFSDYLESKKIKRSRMPAMRTWSPFFFF